MRVSRLGMCALFAMFTVVGCSNGADNADMPETAALQESPAGTSGTQAPAEPSAPAETRDTTAPLPDTASPLPIVGGIGALSLAGAALVRFARRSRA